MNEVARSIFYENIILAKYVGVGLLDNRLSVCLTWHLLSIFDDISLLSRTSVWQVVDTQYLLIERHQQLILRVDTCSDLSETQVRALSMAPTWLISGKLWICVTHHGPCEPCRCEQSPWVPWRNCWLRSMSGENPDMRECFSGLYI